MSDLRDRSRIQAGIVIFIGGLATIGARAPGQAAMVILVSTAVAAAILVLGRER